MAKLDSRLRTVRNYVFLAFTLIIGFALQQRVFAAAAPCTVDFCTTGSYCSGNQGSYKCQNCRYLIADCWSMQQQCNTTCSGGGVGTCDEVNYKFKCVCSGQSGCGFDPED